jgi:hypothetical protein
MTKVGVSAPVDKVQLRFYERDLCATDKPNESGKAKIELVEKRPMEVIEGVSIHEYFKVFASAVE